MKFNCVLSDYVFDDFVISFMADCISFVNNKIRNEFRKFHKFDSVNQILFEIQILPDN